MSFLLSAYRVMTGIAEPLAPLALSVMSRAETQLERQERLGRGVAQPGDTWWHAASMGEVMALEPVLEAFRKRYPEASFRVTTTTTTGRNRARHLWGDQVGLAPLDLPRALRRTVKNWDPKAMILVETEFWPNTLHAVLKHGAKLAWINARVSDRSWPRYQKMGSLFEGLFQNATAIGARSPQDAERILSLGAPKESVRITGNTKHDHVRAAAAHRLPWGQDPLLIAGSVHPAELQVVVEAFRLARERCPNLRLVLVPRHLSRLQDCLMATKAWRTRRWSQGKDFDPETDVLIVDQMGQLLGFYGAGSMAFIGGSLVPVGGHNPLEATVHGLPVAMGPHRGVVSEEWEVLFKSGLGTEVTDPVSFSDWILSEANGNEARREERVAKSKNVMEELKGSGERTLSWLEERGVFEGSGAS